MAKHLVKSLENSSEAETWFWWNTNLMCRWLGALLTSFFECFCPPEGQRLPKHDKNQYGSRHSPFKCVYQTWGLYIILKAMYAHRWVWPIFGCKVGQSVQIGTWCMTPPTRCVCQVSNWYLKTCTKKSGKLLLGALLTPPFKCFCPPDG